MFKSDSKSAKNKNQSKANSIHQSKSKNDSKKPNEEAKQIENAHAHLQDLANTFTVQRKSTLSGPVIQRNAVLDNALKLKIHTMTAPDSNGYTPILGPDEKKLIDKINEIRNLLKHSDNLDERSDTRKYLSTAAKWIGKIDPTGISSGLANAEQAIHYLQQGYNMYKSKSKGEAKPLVEKAAPKSTYGTF